MNIQVLPVGRNSKEVAGFIQNSMNFGLPSIETSNYITSTMNELYNNAVGTAKGMVASSIKSYNEFKESGIFDTISSMMNKSDTIDSLNAIYEINRDNIPDITPTMKRYAMANPFIRNLYDQDRLSGFDDDFVDTRLTDDPNELTHEYMQAMNGFATEEDEEVYAIYGIPEDEVDRELTIIEQINIQNTWDNMINLYNEGIDPTDTDLGEC